MFELVAPYSHAFAFPATPIVPLNVLSLVCHTPNDAIVAEFPNSMYTLPPDDDELASNEPVRNFVVPMDTPVMLSVAFPALGTFALWVIG